MNVPRERVTEGTQELVAEANREAGENLIVLEIRNTGEFESDMRRYFLDNGPLPVGTELRIVFDNGCEQAIPAVGTKFFRRIVVPLPSGVRSARVFVPGRMWWVKRGWLGRGQPAPVVWQPPFEARAENLQARRILDPTDGGEFILNPAEQVDLVFRVPRLSPPSVRQGYVLRMRGYYEFLPSHPENGK
jgi:hypothetical protein